MADLDPYTTAREDFAKLIAQETSGLEGSLPEQDDFDLAEIFINIINGERRHQMSRSDFAKMASIMIDPVSYSAPGE